MLDLTENKLVTDDGIRGLTNLTILNLHRNVGVAGDGLFELTQLRRLDLHCNNFISYESYRHLPYLCGGEFERQKEKQTTTML
jgi:Leucine-rich repeat (LRR) protein